MFASTNGQDDKTPKKRFGLIPARIGAQFAHKLSVEIPLEEPKYPTSTGVEGALARTKIARTTPHYAHAMKNGVSVPSRALPGATIMLETQDISRLEEDLLPQVKWSCMHRECKGKSFASKDELFRAHAKQKELVEEAHRDPLGGQPHVYIGCIEIAGTPATKDEKGKVTREAVPPVTMLVSDVE